MQQLGVDGNTGLSPVTWGSWETTWTGTKEVSRSNMGNIYIGTKLVSSTTTRATVRQSRKEQVYKKLLQIFLEINLLSLIM